MGLISEIKDLEEQIADIRGAEILHELRRLDEYSLHLFNRNFEALNELVEGLSSPEVDHGVFMNRINRGKSHVVQKEILFRLHNYVASAKSLVDHSRIVYEEMYEDEGNMDEYESKKEDRLIEDAVVQFVQELRHMCQHYKLPYVGSRWEVMNNDFKFLLNKDELLQFDSWNSRATEFIESHDESIDLKNVIKKYHEKVLDFHRWVRERFQKMYSSELEEIGRINKELNDKKKELIVSELEDALYGSMRDQGLYGIRFVLAGALGPKEQNQLLEFENNLRVWIREALEIVQSKVDLPSELVDEVHERINDTDAT
jgi:hypothetical protein